MPWATKGAPGAVADTASMNHSPARKKFVSGSRASTWNEPGTDVNQLGGSTLAVSYSAAAAAASTARAAFTRP
jgi:hypothetical protein